MSSGGIINLGQVAFVDGGTYDSTVSYKKFYFVTDEDSCYLSRKDGNKGNALTDTNWWKCLANGKQATQAAIHAMNAVNSCNEAIANAERATVSANSATVNANSAANAADTAAESTNSVLLQVNASLETINSLLPELRNAVQTAINAYDLISEVEGVNVYAHIPATIVAESVVEAVIGSTPKIFTELFPRTANQSVIYQAVSGGGSVNPDGVITSPTTAGEMVIYVVSTQNSNVWKEIKVSFRAPEARTTENGTARTTEDGTAIEC